MLYLNEPDLHRPLRQGKALDQIPFVFHGPRNALPAVDKMPLADIVHVNLGHYRLDADYKHGLHFTALPTAWVSGFDKTTELRIGSSTAWVADSVGAVAGFLEFRGHGLNSFFVRGATRNGRGFLKGGPPLPGPLPHFMAERGKTA
jgi:hypothetical protein